jgi:ribonuclease HI
VSQGGRPSPAEVLRFVAQEESLEQTLEHFGLTREQLERLLSSFLPAAAREPEPKPKAPVATAPVTTTYKRVRVYSDGAARGNPGPAGAGAVIAGPEGQVLERLGRFLGVQTNNVAEYEALLLGLERARQLGAEEVAVFADSELMIRQLQGTYRVKNEGLKPLYEQAVRHLEAFQRYTLQHIPRAENKEADEMSNRAIDERMG